MMGFRLDRTATLLAYSFLKNTAARRRRVPILMYHDIAGPGRVNGNPYYHTATTIEAFTAQMDHLHRAGYRVVDLDDLVSGRVGHGEKAVVITFDDGLRTFRTRAFPVLARYGFTATVFLVTGCVEAGGLFKEGECLSWSEIRELAREGISFGSHTVTHPLLRFLDQGLLAHEVVHSRWMIEDRTGMHVRYFSYPYAFPEEDRSFTRSLQELLAAAGYRACVTTSVGRAATGELSFFLSRIPVNSLDDVSLFRAKLEGGYDWVHLVQLWSKKARFLAGGSAAGSKIEGGGAWTPRRPASW
ncbi:MAG: polysaccharide deacetylase family protein [Spirochaetota bacterium]